MYRHVTASGPVSIKGSAAGCCSALRNSEAAYVDFRKRGIQFCIVGKS